MELVYNLRTAWLFTASDHLTFVLPEVFIGMCGLFVKDLIPAAQGMSPLTIVKQSLKILAWNWMNTFMFVLANQGSQAALEEDAINKPWRPIPAGRITVDQTRELLIGTIPIFAGLCHWQLGAFQGTIILICLTWIYNDLGASDKHFLVRNGNIAAAYFFYGKGSLQPEIFDLIDDPRNQSHKTDWYDLLRPAKAVISERDPKLHGRRRRLWDKALNPTSLTEYKPLIEAHMKTLLSNVEDGKLNQRDIKANDIFYWFAFDLVFELALGKSFGMQQEKCWHKSTLQLRNGMGLLGIASPVPWLARIAFAFCWNFPVVRDWSGLQAFLKNKMTERVDRGMDRKDIAQHFIDVAEEGGWTKEDWRWLHGDAMNVLIAGSETTAATMVFLFAELAKNEGLVDRLFHEIKDTYPSDLEALRNAKLLNGIINETLRLYPALPSAAYRETLPEGLIIGDVYVPGGTKIIAPRYSVARLEDAFQHAEEFIPERWMDEPELVRYPKAFAPFAAGRYSCVGKQLALNEIRMVTASLVQRFRVSLAPGEQGTAVFEDMKDQMAVFPGPLRIAFVKRGDEERGESA